MRKRTAKILKITAIVIVALGVIYAIATAVSSAKLRRAYAELKKDGRPMKQAEIIPPKVPDSDNAALLYESAALLLKAQPAPDGNLLEYLGELCSKFIDESIEPDKLTELRELIEQESVTQALSIIEDGTRKRSCRFDYDYNAGFNMLMPNLSHTRDMIRIMSVKSCILAEAGRTDAAWQLALIQLRFADAMRNEPILISFLVRLVSIRTSCVTIQRICQFAPPNEEQYHILEKLLLDYEDRDQLVLAMDGERLLGGEWAFNMLRNGSAQDMSVLTGDESELIEMLMGLYSAFKPLFLADKAAYMRIIAEQTRSVQQPYSPNKAGDVDRKAEQMYSSLNIITSIILPALHRVKERYWQIVAQMRITRAGLALLQDSKIQGPFPDALGKLKLKDINDPFSGEPLVYKPDPNGFVLYSVGPDEKDNGGRPKQNNKDEEEWDIVFSYTGER